MQTKKRPSSKRQRRVGLARVTAERLEEVRRDAGMTVAQFAAACREGRGGVVGHSSMVAWRAGRSVPGGDYLRRIAAKFGVSVDWLLGLEGAPKFRLQVRSQPALAIDFGEHCRRAASAMLARTCPWVEPAMLQVDATTALDMATTQIAAGAVETIAVLRKSAVTGHGALTSADPTLRELATVLARDGTPAVRKAVLRALVEIRQLVPEAQLLVRAEGAPLRPAVGRLWDLLGPDIPHRLGAHQVESARVAGFSQPVMALMRNLLGMDDLGD